MAGIGGAATVAAEQENEKAASAKEDGVAVDDEKGPSGSSVEEAEGGSRAESQETPGGTAVGHHGSENLS